LRRHAQSSLPTRPISRSPCTPWTRATTSWSPSRLLNT
jgi:hypothetical protein